MLVEFFKRYTICQLFIRHRPQRLIFLFLRMGEVIGHVPDVVFIITTCDIKILTIKEMSCIVREIHIGGCTVWRSRFSSAGSESENVTSPTCSPLRTISMLLTPVLMPICTFRHLRPFHQVLALNVTVLPEMAAVPVVRTPP